ncbi:MAG: hypothetical protein IKR40_01765, partial [Treponema sp.]|nr:hypothetical protein [Treponema sp.]
MTTFDTIWNEGRQLYEHIHSSRLYIQSHEYTDVAASDVFLSTVDKLFGCFGYKSSTFINRNFLLIPNNFLV